MPTGRVSKSSIAKARKLRTNSTNGERRLWLELRQFRRLYNLHVRRQAPIGPYIVDFVVPSKKLIIEIDGEFHFRTNQMRKDEIRNKWLGQRGYSVLRINTGELSDDFDGCVETIIGFLRDGR